MGKLNGYKSVAEWLGIVYKGKPSERGLLQAMGSGSKSRFSKGRTWDSITRWPHLPTVHDIATRLHIPPLAILCALYPVDADDLRYVISALKAQGITNADLQAAVEQPPVFTYAKVTNEPDRRGIIAALESPARESYRAIAARFGVSPGYVGNINKELEK